MTKTAVFAVIKDESAYIHEWIFHHLYFGFDHIYIAVNRTTDNTIEILKKIQLKFPQVKYFNTDWIDMDSDVSGQNSSMQRLSYAYLTHQCAINNDDITHILPIDADEFWFPSDFKTKVNEFINTAPNFDLMSFHWACQSVDKVDFSLPFENNKYYHNCHVKSLISYKLFDSIEKFTLHVPKLRVNLVEHVDASFNVFESGSHREISNLNYNRKQKAYILHRMIRSETEYLALLQRRRPSSKLVIKDNRNGIQIHNNIERLNLNTSLLSKYHETIKSFVLDTEIKVMLEERKKNIVDKSRDILKVSDDILFKHLDIYYKALNGTKSLDKLHQRVLDYKGSHSIESVNHIRDVAIKLESIDLDKSIDLMRVAQVHRPNGVTIKKKLGEYLLKKMK